MSDSSRPSALHIVPAIVQLKTGDWVVANLPGTPLWNAVFKTRIEAACALSKYRIGIALDELNRRVEAARMGL
jgi:hypothetical protein